MSYLQHLIRSKYERPLMGMPAIYAENTVEVAAIRGDAIELYDQLINAVTLILEETGVLLPMYHRALFSDSAYAAIIKVSQKIAAVQNFMQMKHLEVWRSSWHFAGIRWLNRTRKAINFTMMVASIDCHLERVLTKMEEDVREWNLRATELTAWARINATTLHQRNAAILRSQWEETDHHLERMEGNDIPKLIQKTGGFEMMNMDSDYNLYRMVTMQDEAAVRDLHHGKKRHHQYGGILGVWRDEGEPEEFNHSLPRIRQEPDYDSDDYHEAFNESFKIGYPLVNLGCVLMRLGLTVTRERLTWAQQIRDRPGRKIRDPVYAKKGRFEPDDGSQFGSAAPSEYGDDDQGMFAVPRG